MFCRSAATICAGALVLVSPIGANLDAVHPIRASLALPAPAHDRGQARENDRDNETSRPIPAAISAWDKDDQADDEVLAETPAFGFGPMTGFYPSDEPRELVLTFDDGPDLRFTPIVLEELDRRGLKAIFFVTGHRVIGDRPEDLARRELLGRIAAHGHMVANHTMTHRDLCRAEDDVATEIDANAEVITQATGVRPLLFRAPYGAYCRKLGAALAERQLVSVGWNLDPQDWKNPTSEGTLEYLQSRLTRLKGRGILLLHDTHAASVYALGPLLDWIARENRRDVSAGRPPIVLRDYAVFLPVRPVPRTSVGAVAGAVLDTVMARATPGFGSRSSIAAR